MAVNVETIERPTGLDGKMQTFTRFKLDKPGDIYTSEVIDSLVLDLDRADEMATVAAAHEMSVSWTYTPPSEDSPQQNPESNKLVQGGVMFEIGNTPTNRVTIDQLTPNALEDHMLEVKPQSHTIYSMPVEPARKNQQHTKKEFNPQKRAKDENRGHNAGMAQARIHKGFSENGRPRGKP